MNIKNHTSLMGRLTRDFYVCESKSGYILFSTIAVETKFGTKTTTDFIEFKMFAQTDKALAYLKSFGKGDFLAMSCRLTTYKKDDQTILQVVADSLEVLESPSVRKSRKKTLEPVASSVAEEDLPF